MLYIYVPVLHQDLKKKNIKEKRGHTSIRKKIKMPLSSCIWEFLDTTENLPDTTVAEQN